MLKEINTITYPTGKEDDPGYATITVYDGLTEEQYDDLFHLRGNQINEYLHLDKPDNYLVTPGALYCTNVRVLTYTRTCVVVERRYNYNI